MKAIPSVLDEIQLALNEVRIPNDRNPLSF